MKRRGKRFRSGLVAAKVIAERKSSVVVKMYNITFKQVDYVWRRGGGGWEVDLFRILKPPSIYT